MRECGMLLEFLIFLCETYLKVSTLLKVLFPLRIRFGCNSEKESLSIEIDEKKSFSVEINQIIDVIGTFFGKSCYF